MIMDEIAIVWAMCPYCEEEVEVYAGEDVECPHCHLHFTPSQEEIKESLRNQ
jgi:hypothetical protein